jgi:ubiquinone/menaquinone biosynthesis C-methylase UbiE
VLDVGGAAGAYALPLAAEGYEVHLVDPVSLHVEQARAASDGQPDAPVASAQVGDARELSFADGSADSVLMLPALPPHSSGRP